MADKAVKMVVVNGVRYREEHAPKTEKRDDEKPVENKMRTTKTASKK